MAKGYAWCLMGVEEGGGCCLVPSPRQCRGEERDAALLKVH